MKKKKNPNCDNCEDCQELGCNYHDLVGSDYDKVESDVDDIDSLSRD